MKITAVTIVRRRTHGPYEHEEITAHAEIDQQIDQQSQLIKLRADIDKALYADLSQVQTQAPVEAKPEVKADKPAPKKAAAAKSVKEEAAKETIEGKEVPPVIPSENAGGASKVVGSVDTANVTHVQSEAPKASAPVVGKGVVAYDPKNKDMRSRFATYLNNNFPKWTPDAQFGKLKEGEQPSAERVAYANKVTTFSKALEGKPFEDAKGNMLESFATELETFFSYAK